MKWEDVSIFKIIPSETSIFMNNVIFWGMYEQIVTKCYTGMYLLINEIGY